MSKIGTETQGEVKSKVEIPSFDNIKKERNNVIAPNDLIRKAVICKKSRPRVGVPGHKAYHYDGNIFKDGWSTITTSATQSFMFKVQMSWLFIVLSVFSGLTYSDHILTARFSEAVYNTVMGLSIFLLPFFVAQVYSRYTARMDALRETQAALKNCIAHATGSHSKLDAFTLLRYVNAILHLNYFLYSTGHTHDRWQGLMERGLLKQEEVDILSKQDAPEVILNSWVIKLTMDEKLWTHCSDVQVKSSNLSEYSRNQIPYIYLSTVSFLVNFFVFVSTWNTFGLDLWFRFMNFNCESIVTNYEELDTFSDGSCIPGLLVGLFGQIILIIAIASIYSAALLLCEPFGSHSNHYDLGSDLDECWRLSLEAIESMDNEAVEKVLSSIMANSSEGKNGIEYDDVMSTTTDNSGSWKRSKNNFSAEDLMSAATGDSKWKMMGNEEDISV